MPFDPPPGGARYGFGWGRVSDVEWQWPDGPLSFHFTSEGEARQDVVRFLYDAARKLTPGPPYHEPPKGLRVSLDFFIHNAELQRLGRPVVQSEPHIPSREDLVDFLDWLLEQGIPLADGVRQPTASTVHAYLDRFVKEDA